MSQRQCLPLNDGSSDDEESYDFTKLPETAENYLKQVRIERKQIPKVVVHPIPQKYQTAPTSIKNDTQPKGKCEKYHPNYPTSEWQQMQQDKFSLLQQKIAELRNDPKIDRRLAGEMYILTENEQSCIKYCQHHEPLLSVIMKLGQYQLEELIDHLATHLSEQVEQPEYLQQASTTESIWLTKWIYSALACLRMPLDPELHNHLRFMARSCIQVRDHLKLQDSIDPLKFLPWNLLIVIVAKNFHQFDLLQNL